MGEEHRCPHCRKVLGPDDPPGLCGRCLLAQGLLDADRDPRPAGELIPELRFLDPLYGEATEESPGRYTERREHARGGMGRILLAHDEHLARDIVIKELLGVGDVPADSGHSPLDPSTPLTARFLREARITAGLEHPSIVPVHELGYRDDGTLYYTMKRVEGVSLSEAIREAGGLSGRLRLLPHYLDLCQAIAFAHSRGVVHRDIKPGNVMVSAFGETVVLDWGLAKRLGTAGEALEPESAAASGKADDTVQGQVLGTPVYMAPEQARGATGEVDERTDVYALGAVLYTLLTARTPFPSDSRTQVIRQVLEEEPTRIRDVESDAPGELVAIAEKAMAKASEDRYTSARELADEVQQYLTGGVVRAYDYRPSEHLVRFARQHRTGLVAALACVVLLVSFAASAYVRVVQERDRALRAEYARTIPLAALHIERGEVGLAEPLLAGCPPDLREWEWGHLYGQCHPEERAVQAHEGQLTGFALSPERGHIATAGVDGTVALWDSRDLRELWRVTDAGRVRALAYAPGGQSIAGLVGQEELLILSAEGGDVVHGTVPASTGQEAEAPAPEMAPRLLFSPDGAWLYGLADQVVTVWQTADWAVARRIRDLRVKCRTGLVLSRDGKALVVGGSSGRNFQLEGLDAATGTSLWFREEPTILEDASGVTVVAYPDEDAMLCTYGYALGTFSLSAEPPRKLAECELPPDHIYATTVPSVAPGGESFVVGNLAGTVLGFAPEDGFIGAVGMEAPLNHVGFGRDEASLVVADNRGRLKVMDRTALTRPANRIAFDERETGSACGEVAFSPDSHYLAVDSMRVPELVTVWDLETGQRRHLPTPAGTGAYLDFVPSTGELMMPTPGVLHFYHVADWATSRKVPVDGMVEGGQFDTSGHWLVAKVLGKEPRVFDLESGAKVHPFKSVAALSGSDPMDVSVAMQAEGNRCAATCKDADRVWVAALPAGDIELELTFDRASVSGPRGLAFHPTKPLLAAGHTDGTLVVWDLGTGERAATFHDPGGEIYALAFSPDGRRLATTTPQRSVRVWDWEIGVELIGVRCQSHFALDVAFSPDGETLAFADGNQASTQVLLGADGAVRQARWREYAKGRAACLENVLELDAAHLDWADKHTADAEERRPDVHSLLTPKRRCPAGGKYTLGAVNELPTCTVHGSFQHDLDALAASLEQAHQVGEGAVALCEARLRRTLVDSPGYLNGVAWRWAEEGHQFYEAAVLVSRRALELEPDHGGLLDTLACTEQRAGHLDDAAQHFREAIEAGVDSRPRLAQTLAQRAKPGDLEEACALLETYLATEPVDDNVRAALEALAQAGADGPLAGRIDALRQRAAQ